MSHADDKDPFAPSNSADASGWNANPQPVADAIDPYALPDNEITEPPESLWNALKKIGPGIVLTGSIVGSGELILTTALGAKHGFIFLWLVLFSCFIKVIVQIELGRYAISAGKPTLGVLHEMPVGRILGTTWLVWWWFCMLLATVFQLGAMCGGVGQALNLAFPSVSPAIGSAVGGHIQALLEAHPEHPWAMLTALAAIALLLSGGYRRLEKLTTILVVSVTALTVLGVVMLPAPKYSLDAKELLDGLTFNGMLALDKVALPLAIAAAFSCFGITGVGASELYQYPYWCLEKGYARYVGRRTDDEAWARRAKGWIRVMRLDAWVSMFVFTAATLAFYFMGAIVLHRNGLAPEGKEMVKTLSTMYSTTFGEWTRFPFLIGVWAVLFKTLYVSAAAHSRLTTDLFMLTKFLPNDTSTRARSIKRLCIFYPCLALTLFLLFAEPKGMVIIGGFVQAATLPIITGVTVYLRYKRLDRRLVPSRFWDLCLWGAFISITVVASYAIYDWGVNKLKPVFETKKVQQTTEPTDKVAPSKLDGPREKQ